ncbi:MAG: response regulator, partial [Spirochaetaceae bacterium]|nr:response regulator [Spirochaetaceae bacterium]
MNPNPEAKTATKGDILVVDDTPANLRVLSRLLTDNGYKVRPVPNGALAIEAVKAAPPDLIFLDIRMPDMDGYEVCERLKQDSASRNIPVIFISAMSEIEEKVKGFKSGCVDFITKPFQEGEVLIRLENHLTIRRQRQEIQTQYVKLKELEVMRETLIQMIVHDLNNPLHAILGFGQLLTGHLQRMDTEQASRDAASITCSAGAAIDMIEAILDVAKLECNEMSLNVTSVDISSAVADAVKGMRPLLDQDDLHIHQVIPDDIPQIHSDAGLFGRILVNMISNAIKFSPTGGTITISAVLRQEMVQMSVSDQGPGIPEEYSIRIFEKYGQIESRKTGTKYSTGLGLTFCKMAVEAHGGEIGIINNKDGGST